MRHGESVNNIFALISKEQYENNRSYEPELSGMG